MCPKPKKGVPPHESVHRTGRSWQANSVRGCGCVSGVSDSCRRDCWFCCLDFASTIRRDCLGPSWPLAWASRNRSHGANPNRWSAEALLQSRRGGRALLPHSKGKTPDRITGWADQPRNPLVLSNSHLPGPGGGCDGDVPVAPFAVLKPCCRTPKEYLPFRRGWEEAGAYSERGPRRPAGQHSGATRPCYYRPSFLFRCSAHPEAQPPHHPCHSNAAAPIALPASQKLLAARAC